MSGVLPVGGARPAGGAAGRKAAGPCDAAAGALPRLPGASTRRETKGLIYHFVQSSGSFFQRRDDSAGARGGDQVRATQRAPLHQGARLAVVAAAGAGGAHAQRAPRRGGAA